ALRVRFLAYTPRERVVAAGARLHDALARGGPGEVSVRELGEGQMLDVDGAGVLLLTPEDADTLSGETFEGTVKRAEARLRTAVSESRESRDAERLLRGGLAALAATLVAWLLLRAAALLRRKASFHLDRALRSRLEALQQRAPGAVPHEPLLGLARGALRIVFLLLGALIVVAWLDFSLTRLPFTRPFGERFNEVLLGAVTTGGKAVLGTIPGLLVAAVIFVLTRFIANALDSFFRRVESGAITVSWVDRDIAPPTRRIAVFLLWVFAVVMAYPYLPGSGTDAFKGISVLLGLMVSLGASSLVGQGAAGLMLMYSRALRAGEWVRVGESEGKVTSIGMLTTRLRTGLGDEIVLPNTVVMAARVENYTRLAGGRGVLVKTGVTIGYTEPWRQVEALLLLAAERTASLRRDPAPVVVRHALSDFYVDYRLYAYTDDADGRLTVLSNLHANILDAFNEHGVQIMSPHYFGDPAHPAVVPKDRWWAAPARAPEKPPPG
ncbi:MAG TPA: mechanosensitive ion channel, partial [Thermoanaerobaculia bacterium]|nr:mechanosensitive ion channel [Thermoanaerobaculia bacterium]